MSVTIRSRGPEGPVSIDLEKIPVFRITRQRNTCGLLAITPENPRPQTPYPIARRDREWQLQEILESPGQLRAEKLAGIVFELTERDARRVSPAGSGLFLPFIRAVPFPPQPAVIILLQQDQCAATDHTPSGPVPVPLPVFTGFRQDNNSRYPRRVPAVPLVCRSRENGRACTTARGSADPRGSRASTCRGT